MDWRYAVQGSNVDGNELRGNGFPLGCVDRYFWCKYDVNVAYTTVCLVTFISRLINKEIFP